MSITPAVPSWQPCPAPASRPAGYCKHAACQSDTCCGALNELLSPRASNYSALLLRHRGTSADLDLDLHVTAGRSRSSCNTFPQPNRQLKKATTKNAFTVVARRGRRTDLGFTRLDCTLTCDGARLTCTAAVGLAPPPPVLKCVGCSCPSVNKRYSSKVRVKPYLMSMYAIGSASA